MGARPRSECFCRVCRRVCLRKEAAQGRGTWIDCKGRRGLAEPFALIRSPWRSCRAVRALQVPAAPSAAMVEAFRSVLSDLLVKKHCKVQPDLLLEFAK